MSTPTPVTSSTITVALRLDVIEEASGENGCIDKYKCHVTMTIPEPFNISFFPARAPVAIIPVRPFYTADFAYSADPPDEWPLDAIALFYSAIDGSYVQSSRAGYATDDGLTSGAIVELWFHRSAGVDISTGDFATEFSPDPVGKYIYHYNQVEGFEFKLRSYYQNGIDAFSQPTYGLAETSTGSLSMTACSGSGSEPPANGIYTEDPAAICTYTEDTSPSCTYAEDPAATCTYTEDVL